MKNIKYNDRKELLFLFFKLYIFTSSFYVDVFIEKKFYTKFFIYLNLIRNILLGRLLEIVGNDIIHIFHMNLSQIESSISGKIFQIRKVLYLVLLLVSFISFLTIFVIAYQNRDTNNLLSIFVNFFVITGFLLGCFIYYTKFRK